MQIKIDINLNLSNFNQIINQLSQLLPSTDEKIKQIEPKENIDMTKLREKVTYLTNGGNLEIVQEILNKYNAKKITDVKPDDYEKLYNEIINHIN
ncbi:MAG: hypothetical protein ACRC92_16520 [Peptostreptococcaceae bacterium]